MSENYRNQLCEKLLLWSLEPDAIEITDFCIINDITEGSLNKLAQRHECIKEARDEALDTIMARREKGAIFGQIGGKRVDGNSIIKLQAQQSRRYREMLSYVNALRNPSVTTANTQYEVFMTDEGEGDGHKEPDTAKQVQE